MIEHHVVTFLRKLKNVFIGPARSFADRTIFHNLSLIALFAWVGLGADGLSSSCYGPEEIFRTLSSHPELSLFVALATGLTIFLISASYTQIIELFPNGGGAYVVASKLISPYTGMVAGAALLIDYVLTIALSVASGVAALFSMFPEKYHFLKVEVMLIGILLLMLLNLRGVKESVAPLVPIFFLFVFTHLFAVCYALFTHMVDLPEVMRTTQSGLSETHQQLGWFGAIALMLRAYSMGAGTFTGIEAVSNALPMLREPRVATAKTTMRYMSTSLAFMSVGLLFAYVLLKVVPSETKTLNAVLLESMTISWNGTWAFVFVGVALLTETALLFVAAQTGFLGGPRVIANMAVDRWFPSKFAALSDRLVNHNGILMMGIGAILVLLMTMGSVGMLVVLYSINVFITFTLSQAGMVRYWWHAKGDKKRWSGLFINGIGLIATSFILISVTVIKFGEGGWATIMITGSLVVIAILIRSHYDRTKALLSRLDALVEATEVAPWQSEHAHPVDHEVRFDPKAKTAVVLVNGFNGTGLHTFFTILREFQGVYHNFVFVMVGQLDAGTFKGLEEIEALEQHVKDEVGRYLQLARSNELYAEAVTGLGTDVVLEITKLAKSIRERYPNSMVFGSQIIFSEDFLFSRWLHNYTLFSLQRHLSYAEIPLVVLPLRT